MKIIVATDAGKVIATYDAVEWWDARDESPQWRALLRWLRITLRKQRPTNI